MQLIIIAENYGAQYERFYFEKILMNPDDFVPGRLVWVFWGGDQVFYRALIEKYNSETKYSRVSCPFAVAD